MVVALERCRDRWSAGRSSARSVSRILSKMKFCVGNFERSPKSFCLVAGAMCHVDKRQEETGRRGRE